LARSAERGTVGNTLLHHTDRDFVDIALHAWRRGVDSTDLDKGQHMQDRRHEDRSIGIVGHNSREGGNTLVGRGRNAVEGSYGVGERLARNHQYRVFFL